VNVQYRISMQKSFIFQPHASALPAETGNPEIASFHLNDAALPANAQNTLIHVYCHLVTGELPFVC